MSFFAILRSNYPSNEPCHARNDKGELLFQNQRAIRLSYAMRKSGISLARFPSARKCWVHKGDDHILAAKELADWLDRGTVAQLKKSQDVTGGNWRSKVLDKKGIICFEDYYATRGGSRGDHIDL